MDRNAPAVFTSGPGQLLIELPQPRFQGTRVAAFIETLEAFELLGIKRFRRLRNGVIVDYDDSSLDVQDIQSLLAAALTRFNYAAGDHPTSTHILPVTFGGSAGPDLPMACLLLDTPKPALIRRICRSKHIIRSFSGPGASALLEVPWAEAWPYQPSTGHAARMVRAGSLTLSTLGVTLISHSCYTDDLVVGRVDLAPLRAHPEILIGDSVWLRSKREPTA